MPGHQLREETRNEMAELIFVQMSESEADGAQSCTHVCDCDCLADPGKKHATVCCTPCPCGRSIKHMLVNAHRMVCHK